MRILNVAIDSIEFDPKNARKHGERNLESIANSLKQFGQQKPIVLDAEGKIVVAGNGTLHAARELGWKEIKAIKTNLSAKEARKFAVADNRSAELAEWDGEELVGLISSLEQLEAEWLGFTSSEVSRMRASFDFENVVEDISNEWEGMPEFSHRDLESKFKVTVHFKTEEDLLEFGRRMDQSVTPKTRSMWFPPDEVGTIADKRYVDEGDV